MPTVAPVPEATTTLPLTCLKVGQTGVVASASLDREDAKLLAAMGLCEGASIRLCRLGQPCIVAVGGGVVRARIDATGCCGGGGVSGSCRIGLARPLAERISVTVVA